jgi:hypothetical protein
VIRVASWTALCALALTSCSVALSGDDVQCTSDADCEARGFANATCEASACIATDEVDPIWGCVGEVDEPTPDTSNRITVSLRLAYAAGGGPVTDAVVDVCARLDIGCTGADSDEFPKGIAPDANGVFTASVREGFDGYMRVTGTIGDPAEDVMDTRVYVGRPLFVAPKVEEVRLLLPNEYEALSAAIAQTAADPTRGTMIGLAVDCQGDAAAGVRFETPNADGESEEFYLIGQGPVKPPAAENTDKDGFGGFFNVEPGAVVLRAIRAEDDTYIGESSLQVLPYTISFVLVAPTPQ